MEALTIVAGVLAALFITYILLQDNPAVKRLLIRAIVWSWARIKKTKTPIDPQLRKTLEDFEKKEKEERKRAQPQHQ